MKIKQKELARILEVSLSGLKNWLEEGMPGKLGRDEYDLALIIPWVRRNKGLREESKSLIEERTRLVKLQADLKNLQLLVEQGELITRSTIRDLFMARLHVMKTGLLHLHRKLAAELSGKDPREVSEIVKKATRALLNAYADPRGLSKYLRRR